MKNKELTQIIYLVTDCDGVTVIESIHSSELPETRMIEEKYLKLMYDANFSIRKYAPYEAKIVSIDTSPNLDNQDYVLREAVKSYFNDQFEKGVSEQELITDRRYRRSGYFIKNLLLNCMTEKRRKRGGKNEML